MSKQVVIHTLVQFEVGDLVYLRTDPDQYERMVTGIIVSGGGPVYRLCLGTQESYHHAIEMTAEIDPEKVLHQL
jgi:hypothetical protein